MSHSGRQEVLTPLFCRYNISTRKSEQGYRTFRSFRMTIETMTATTNTTSTKIKIAAMGKIGISAAVEVGLKGVAVICNTKTH